MANLTRATLTDADWTEVEVVRDEILRARGLGYFAGRHGYLHEMAVRIYLSRVNGGR